MDRIEEIAKMHPAGIILREKDLTEEEYRELAKQVLSICEKYQVPCMLHGFVDVALELKTGAIHLPLPVLRSLSEEKKKGFSVLGASCHSEEEAREAELLGCTYVVAGHIFATDCKKGLPGRGTGVCYRRNHRRKYWDGTGNRSSGGLCDERSDAVWECGRVYEELQKTRV